MAGLWLVSAEPIRAPGRLMIVPPMRSSSHPWSTGHRLLLSQACCSTPVTPLPAWKGDIFVGALRTGEIPGTGHMERIMINRDYQEVRRESLITDLHQRGTRC